MIAEKLINLLLKLIPTLNIRVWKIITIINEIQSIKLKPNRNTKNISRSNNELSIEKINILIILPKIFLSSLSLLSSPSSSLTLACDSENIWKLLL